MRVNSIGRIERITGSTILIRVTENAEIKQLDVDSFRTCYVSVGSLIGTRLVDGRILIMTVEEIYDRDTSVFISSTISGIYDEVTEKFSFGTNTYPLIEEPVFKLWDKILGHIFAPTDKNNGSTIGTYVYNNGVNVGYDPNILFGKHLGVFGNTGSLAVVQLID